MAQTRPRVSVVSFARSSQQLDSSLESLVDQTFSDWEWVIVLSSEVRWQPTLPDPRVRIVIDDFVPTSGAGKRLACSVALGEHFVLFEPGDQLTASALDQVVSALIEDPDLALVYGNGNGHRASADGPGEQVDAASPTPHAVSSTAIAPRYCRTLSRTTYETVGGYDDSLDHLADADLVCRLYRYGELRKLSDVLITEGRELDRPSPSDYALRQHDALAFYDRVIEGNALVWAQRRGLLALDASEGQQAPGYLRVARRPGPGVGLVGDLAVGLDLADSSVGVVRLVDTLGLYRDKIAVFNELHRLLADGGLVLSLTPSADGRGGFQDPRSVAFYNENSFWYFTQQGYAQYVPIITARFTVSRLVTYFPSDWHEQHSVPYVCANLVAVKPTQHDAPGA